MAIVNVKYDWSKARTTIGNGRMSGVEVWTVKFDDGDLSRYRQFMATVAPGIPDMYTAHPYQPYEWYYVVAKSARPLGPMLFEVTVQYEGLTLQGGGEPIDPKDVPSVWSWPTSVTEEKIDRDIDDVPITNSAGESPDPPMMKKFYDLVGRVVFYRTSFDAVLAHEYKGTLNSDIFQGFAAEEVLCSEYSAEQMETPFGIRYRINMEFRSRWGGWKRRVRNEGFREYWGTKTDGKPDYREIVDDKDIKVTEPVALDANGRILDDNAPPVWNYFDTNRKLPFSVFEL